MLFASFMRADCRLRNEDVWVLAFLGCIGPIHIMLMGNMNLRGRLFNAMSSNGIFPNVWNTTRSCPVKPWPQSGWLEHIVVVCGSLFSHGLEPVGIGAEQSTPNAPDSRRDHRAALLVTNVTNSFSA